MNIKIYKKKFRILFMIDSKKRDLINIFLLSKVLEKNSYEVFFCRNGLELPFIIKHNIDLVILTQLLSKEWIELANKIKSLGCMVASLHSEGNPHIKKKKILLAKGPVNNYKCLDAVFTWTTEQKKLFEYYNCKNKNLKIYFVGYPRFISLQKKYKKFRDKLIKYTIDKNLKKKTNKYFKTIIISTNFLSADYHDYNSEKKYTNEQPLLERNRLDSKIRKDFLNFINKITNDKKFLFIIKIHPMEKPDIYFNKVIKRSNVYISINDYIDAILPCADILAGRSCHTQYEAIALNKDVLELNLNDKDFYKNKANINNLKQLKNYSDFNNLVKNINKINSDKKSVLYKQKMFKLFNFNNGKSGAEKEILNAINELSQNFNIKKKKSFFEKIYFNLKYEILTCFDFYFHDIFYQKNFKKKIGNRYFFIDYRNRVDKHFHEKDIKILENAYK